MFQQHYFKLAYVTLVILGMTGGIEANSSESASTVPAVVYELWEPSPAPNSGPDWTQNMFNGRPYDKDWESYSYVSTALCESVSGLSLIHI